MMRYGLVVLFLGLSACVPLRDGIDMAYDSYVDRRSQCQGIQDPTQRDACIQVAIQQMAAQVDNYQTRQAKPQMGSPWRETEVLPIQNVTLDPPPPYTPPLPPGVNTSPVKSEEEAEEENEGEEPEETEEDEEDVTP